MRALLIDEWFPINEVSIESLRERIPGIDYPGINRLHVWFARRPLTTCRSVIVTTSIDEERREEILKLIGIPPDKDLVAAQNLVKSAKSSGIK